MKKFSSKPRGRVNMGGATQDKDRDRLNKLGKNFNSIDFEMSSTINESNYTDKGLSIGSLLIGKHSIDLTYSECNRIIQTLDNAQSTHKQKIRLGLF
jgi:hypothetical protein